MKFLGLAITLIDDSGGWIDETSAVDSTKKCYECWDEAHCKKEPKKEVDCDEDFSGLIARKRRDIERKHSYACSKWSKTDGTITSMGCAIRDEQTQEGCDDRGRCLCFTDLCNGDTK